MMSVIWVMSKIWFVVDFLEDASERGLLKLC